MIVSSLNETPRRFVSLIGMALHRSKKLIVARGALQDDGTDFSIPL
jgi:hypothetical protein